jgi:hypothetical protein
MDTGRRRFGDCTEAGRLSTLTTRWGATRCLAAESRRSQTRRHIAVSRYIDVEESYDQEQGTLRLYLVEEDGIVSGIYWDEDYAVQNAGWTASDGASDRVTVTEVHFRRDNGTVVHLAKDAGNAEAPVVLDPEEDGYATS